MSWVHSHECMEVFLDLEGSTHRVNSLEESGNDEYDSYYIPCYYP